METSKKIIVTNKSALVNKYGKGGYSQIETAVNELINADQARFIIDTLVFIDDAHQMQSYHGTAVTDQASDVQNKKAIDAICTALNPDYVAILGAQDIIPMQELVNPADHIDSQVPSDLPYACTASYSTTISDFLSPVRVVGRIPGIPASKQPTDLLAAIRTAASMKGLERKNYGPYFAVSAKVWEGSSKQSISHITGVSNQLHLSPVDGPNWTDNQLIPRIHFVNCHGASNDSSWYGQNGQNYPKAVEAAQIANKIAPNTIAAAECCYGGQLYNPGGVCTSYLNSGSAAFCGSTNVAYGPADGQGQADLITQYFLINLLSTSSAGSALLSARQKYINDHKPLSVYDLKTIAQFNLLGDPSAHPVIPNASTEQKALQEKSMLRADKRISFQTLGEHLNNTVSHASKSVSASIPEEVAVEARKIMKKIKSERVFETSEGPMLKSMSKQFNKPTSRIHIVDEEPEIQEDGTQFIKHRALIAKEIGGKIVSYQLIHAK